MDIDPSLLDKSKISKLIERVPLLNEPGAIWPMIGWYSAACIKPWLEDQGYRFPILNVAGTKGSGKTTLIQRVFMPLFGQVDPKSYDAGTTRFVTLALLGSANAVPIAFSEFRYESVERFLRFILLAYDTGHDPRGRGDQTTVDYPLSAPFSVDGEDLIEDPAARERIVVVHLRPNAIEEGSESYTAFNEFRKNIPQGFGGYYIQQVLEMIEDGTLKKRLDEAREALFETFPQRLPDRVRANHIVAFLGMMLFCDVAGMDAPDPKWLERSITSIYDLESGRARTLADSMIEDVVNTCAQGTSGFRWASDEHGTILYFQLSSAHSWWLTARRRQGRGSLERDAIRAQLREAPYMVESQNMKNTWMFGIDLSAAQEAGLDVPSKVHTREIRVNF